MRSDECASHKGHELQDDLVVHLINHLLLHLPTRPKLLQIAYTPGSPM